MAKRLSFPTRTKRPRRRASMTTFIQRSRNESSEQKAMFHDVMGAGRSHVRRHFFGLNDAEAERCKDLLARELGKRVEVLNR